MGGNQHLLDACCVPDTALHALETQCPYVLASLKLSEVDAEAQRGQISCPSSHGSRARIQTQAGLALDSYWSREEAEPSRTCRPPLAPGVITISRGNKLSFSCPIAGMRKSLGEDGGVQRACPAQGGAA